jgi:hypothetical protein
MRAPPLLDIGRFISTYHFRRLNLEAGYIRSDQLFAAYPNTLRTRFYVRIVRSLRLL